MTKALAAFLAPFVMLVLAVTVLYPVRRLLQRRMADGKLKRFLLFRIADPGGRAQRKAEASYLSSRAKGQRIGRLVARLRK